MLSFILATVLFTQIQPPKATEEQINAAFVKAVFRTSHLQKTFKCQLTTIAKDGDDSTLVVYNYQTTIGRSPSLFRTEGDIQIGIDSKLKHFIAVGDGKNITIYDQSKNVYQVISQKSEDGDDNFLSSGLIPSILLRSSNNLASKLSIPNISDPQAAKEALEIIPKLLAQKGFSGMSSYQATDGCYSMILQFKPESRPNLGNATLTLDPKNSFLQRLRIAMPLEDNASFTVTDVVESIAPASPRIKFTFEIPKRAKQVKELPPLLDSVSSQR